MNKKPVKRSNILAAISLAILIASCDQEDKSVIIIDNHQGSQLFLNKDDLKGGGFVVDAAGHRDILRLREGYNRKCSYSVYSARVKYSEVGGTDSRGPVFHSVKISGSIDDSDKSFIYSNIRPYSTKEGLCFLN